MRCSVRTALRRALSRARTSAPAVSAFLMDRAPASWHMLAKILPNEVPHALRFDPATPARAGEGAARSPSPLRQGGGLLEDDKLPRIRRRDPARWQGADCP